VTRFYKTYTKLCDRARKSPNAIAKELGISSGSVTAWKQGRTPKHETIEKIANFFDVDIEDFFLSDGPRTQEDRLPMSTSIPISQLEYAKGVLSGLLNFSIRSGLVVGDGCAACPEAMPEEYASPALRCRCGYEHALSVAIRCIDAEIANGKAVTLSHSE
jgi:transcriptional regulator with XRE-family HTH domain